jgi:hypothetical protein
MCGMGVFSGGLLAFAIITMPVWGPIYLCHSVKEAVKKSIKSYKSKGIILENKNE